MTQLFLNSSIESVRRSAFEGAKKVNATKGGKEVQHFVKGQIVNYTDKSPYHFYNGVIIDLYSENGYFFYVVSIDGNTRTFRQIDIELSEFQDNLTTQRVRTACNGKTYKYMSNPTNDVITINGWQYKVCDVFGYAIQIKKTKINASGGAFGLVKFLSTFDCSDTWERKILENVKPIQ